MSDALPRRIRLDNDGRDGPAVFAARHPPSRTQRLVGAASTLTIMALLAFAIFRPIQLKAEPPPDVIEFATIKPDIALNIPPPAVPLQKIDLPPPVAMVSFLEFEAPAESPALPSLAPTTSPDAVPRPSGYEDLFGKADGTGPANGLGSIMVPPIRKITADTPFHTSKRSRAGLVTSLNFCVTDRGRVGDVQLAATSGFNDMDAAATRWLERQRFEPGTLDGIAAKMCATYDVRWTNSNATSAEAQAAADAHAAAVRKRSRYPRQFVHWPYDRPFPGCDAVDICQRDRR